MNKLFLKFMAEGVLPRSQTKNDLCFVRRLISAGLACKVYKHGHVFYELTEKALPLLNQYRKILLEQGKLNLLLFPRKKAFYDALLDDVRFLDTSKPEAKNFRFLGDWRLQESPVRSQLLLAQWRFYKERGMA